MAKIRFQLIDEPQKNNKVRFQLIDEPKTNTYSEPFSSNSIIATKKDKNNINLPIVKNLKNANSSLPMIPMNTKAPETPTFTQRLVDNTLAIPKVVAKTALTTANYIGQGVMKGAETIGDTALQIGSSKANPYYWFNPDKLESHQSVAKELIKRDGTNEFINNLAGDDNFNKNFLDKDSLVKSDNLGGQVATAIGQMLPSIATGNPTAGTSILGTQAYGGGIEEAYNEGATREQANLYGLGSAATEIATEWLTGGIPGLKGSGGLDRFVAKGLGQKSIDEISNSMTKEIIKAGYKMAGEGMEEALSEMINPILKNATYSKDEKIKWDDVFESAIVGAITGGILEAPANIYNIKGARNNQINSNISQNNTQIEEKKQKPINEPINQETLQNRLQNKPVETDLNSRVTQMREQEQNMSLNDQITQMREQDLARKQVNEQKRLTNQVNQIENKVDKLSDTSKTFAQDNKTINKYQYVKSDNSKIDNLRQDVSKLGWNNSDKTNNYINMLEKIIFDKNVGIRFDANLTDNFGRLANGKYENGVITINPNSTRAGEFIAIHELTHAIGTDSMKNIVENYRKSNQEFDKAVTELLGKNYNTNELTEEAMADVAGQLFGNQEFINNLSQTNPSLFKKIYNEIKYLWHQFTGYKNQNQFIEDLRYKWEQAYRNNKELNDVKTFSRIYNNDGTINRIKINDDIFENSNGKSISKIIKEYLEDHIGEIYTIIESGQKVYLGEDLPGEYAYSDYTKNLPAVKKIAKGRAASNLHEIIETVTNRQWEKNKKEKHKIDAKYGFYKYDTTFSFEHNGKEKTYTGTVVIRNDANGKKYLYDIVNIKPQKKLVNLPSVASNSKMSLAINDGSSNQSIDNISQNNKNVKNDISSTKYSIQETQNDTQHDNEGRKLSKQQQEYFKDSKARDENGNLITVYHTTTDKVAQFNEFNPTGTDYYKFGDQVVNYYTDSKEMSGSYADQHYKMADTRKLTSLEDVNNYLKEFNESFNTLENPSGNAAYIVKEENGKYNVYNEVENDIIASAKDFINTLNTEEREFIKKYLQDGASKALFEDRYGLTSEQEDYIKKYEDWTFNQYSPKSLSHAPQNYLAMLLMDTYTNRPVATYDSKEQLFRNLKTDLEVDNYEKRSKLQYAGYVNITKPYIIDAEGRTWNKVESKADSDITKELLKVKDEDRQYLERLASDSIKTYNDNLFNYQQAEHAINDFAVDRTNTTLEQRLMHRTIHDLGFEEFMKVLNNSKEVYWGRRIQFMDDMFNNGFATYKQKQEFDKTGNIPTEVLDKVNKLIHEEAKFEDRFAKKELEAMGMKPDIKSTTIYDLWNNQDKAYKTFDEGGRYEYSKFNNQVDEKNLYRAIDNEILFKVAKKGFNDDNIRLLYNDWSVTNDIVKSIIGLNKVGENYDGLIIKNVVDYGGDSDTHDAHDLFITLNSNQFKAVDNTTPTNDADIRYSKGNKTWQGYLEDNFKSTGTRTNLQDLKSPTKEKTKLPVNKEVKQIAPVEKKKVNLPTKDTINENKRNDVLKVESERIAEMMNRDGGLNIKERSWVETSTESSILRGKVFSEDLDFNRINYTVLSNKTSLETANNKLNKMGYDKALEYVNNLTNSEHLPSASDMALAQRVLQEAAKKGDTQTVQNLIMDISILGTDLGQATQALSIINKLTPEGQLRMYTKIVDRAKARGEKSFQNVEITPEMVQNILEAYQEDGTYNQEDLNQRVEVFKRDIAKQLQTTTGEKINSWRYLSMLGNPKTHIRNIVSNIAMGGTIKVKNAMARTLETIAPIKNKTKTWKKASQTVQDFASKTALEMKDVITGEAKYNEKGAIESKKQIFKNKALEKISNFNSNALEMEDWFFSKRAFKDTLQEYLTANGITTQEDIDNNPEIVEKGKQYAVNQAEIATFRQYSTLASKINQIERGKGKVAKLVIESTIPFKKTPINVAKAGVNYSPIGLIKNVSYDLYQLKAGNIEASQFIDNISQGLTGTSLMLIGYALAKAGFLKGAGDDDKESKYDYQLGQQTYSINVGDKSYSISWLSPVAIPLLVGANAYEQLEENKDWNMNVVTETMAKTLDPLNDMSFLSSLTDALSSYNKGTDKIKATGESIVQNYIGQFFPTLFSQIASTMDDTKRSTKTSNNSDWKFGEETARKVAYKIPIVRNQLEPATDIWGKEKKQSSNIITRAFESFLAPYSKTEDISTKLDNEIKKVYGETGRNDVIPGVPYAYTRYKGETYRMSAKEYTKFKETYGQTANKTLNELIKTNEYKNASYDTKAKMIKNTYEYSRALANEQYFDKNNVDYSNSTLTKIDSKDMKPSEYIATKRYRGE